MFTARNKKTPPKERDTSTRPKRGKTFEECWNCNKKGHFARDCRVPRKPTIATQAKEEDPQDITKARRTARSQRVRW
jgi:hypothetical protein